MKKEGIEHLVRPDVLMYTRLHHSVQQILSRRSTRRSKDPAGAVISKKTKQNGRIERRTTEDCAGGAMKKIFGRNGDRRT